MKPPNRSKNITECRQWRLLAQLEYMFYFYIESNFFYLFNMNTEFLPMYLCVCRCMNIYGKLVPHLWNVTGVLLRMLPNDYVMKQIFLFYQCLCGWSPEHDLHSWTDAFSSCSCLLLAASGLSVSKDWVSEEIESMGSEEEHNGF